MGSQSGAEPLEPRTVGQLVDKATHCGFAIRIMTTGRRSPATSSVSWVMPSGAPMAARNVYFAPLRPASVSVFHPASVSTRIMVTGTAPAPR